MLIVFLIRHIIWLLFRWLYWWLLNNFWLIDCCFFWTATSELLAITSVTGFSITMNSDYCIRVDSQPTVDATAKILSLNYHILNPHALYNRHKYFYILHKIIPHKNLNISSYHCTIHKQNDRLHFLTICSCNICIHWFFFLTNFLIVRGKI